MAGRKGRSIGEGINLRARDFIFDFFGEGRMELVDKGKTPRRNGVGELRDDEHVFIKEFIRREPSDFVRLGITKGRFKGAEVVDDLKCRKEGVVADGTNIIDAKEMNEERRHAGIEEGVDAAEGGEVTAPVRHVDETKGRVHVIEIGLVLEEGISSAEGADRAIGGRDEGLLTGGESFKFAGRGIRTLAGRARGQGAPGAKRRPTVPRVDWGTKCEIDNFVGSGGPGLGEDRLREWENKFDGERCNVGQRGVKRPGVDSGATAEVKDATGTGGGVQDAEIVAVIEFPASRVIEGIRIEVRDGAEGLAKGGAGFEGLRHGGAGSHRDSGGEEPGDVGVTDKGEMRPDLRFGEGIGLGFQTGGSSDGGERKKRDEPAVFLAAEGFGDVGVIGCHGDRRNVGFGRYRSHVKKEKKEIRVVKGGTLAQMIPWLK
jgi:hypothetical protein